MTVLTQVHWPLGEPPKVALPPHLQAAANDFSRHYCESYKEGRRLSFCYHLVWRVSGTPGPCDFRGSEEEAIKRRYQKRMTKKLCIQKADVQKKIPEKCTSHKKISKKMRTKNISLSHKMAPMVPLARLFLCFLCCLAIHSAISVAFAHVILDGLLFGTR